MCGRAKSAGTYVKKAPGVFCAILSHQHAFLSLTRNPHSRLTLCADYGRKRARTRWESGACTAQNYVVRGLGLLRVSTFLGYLRSVVHLPAARAVSGSSRCFTAGSVSLA